MVAEPGGHPLGALLHTLPRFPAGDMWPCSCRPLVWESALQGGGGDRGGEDPDETWTVPFCPSTPFPAAVGLTNIPLLSASPFKVLSYKVHPWSQEDAPKASPPLPSAPAVPLLQSRRHILTYFYLSPVTGPGRSPSSFAATCLTGATKTGVLTSSSSPTELESASGLGLRPWLVS